MAKALADLCAVLWSQLIWRFWPGSIVLSGCILTARRTQAGDETTDMAVTHLAQLGNLVAEGAALFTTEAALIELKRHA